MQRESNTNGYVVITSDEPWSDIWHTQLHYAFQLAKRYEVIYLNPPLPWKFSHLFNFKSETFSYSDHLTVTRYLNILPSFLGKFGTWVNDKVNQRLLNALMKQKKKGEKFIVWHFDPFRSVFVFDTSKECTHIYHVIDPFAGHHYDLELARKAQLVILTSPKFLKHYTDLNPNVIQIGQGVDMEFYSQQESIENTKDLISLNSILLLGTITNEVDFQLLAKLAKEFDHGLVLIGPDKITSIDAKQQFQELISIPGVHWLGPMNPSEFRKHVKACTIGIIAYGKAANSKNNMRSPLKVISYLACQKNIISNIDCEIPELSNKAIYLVDKDETYFELIRQSYKNELHYDKKAVHDFLQSIDYSNLLNLIYAKLNIPLPDKR